MEISDSVSQENNPEKPIIRKALFRKSTKIILILLVIVIGLTLLSIFSINKLIPSKAVTFSLPLVSQDVEKVHYPEQTDLPGSTDVTSIFPNGEKLATNIGIFANDQDPENLSFNNPNFQLWQYALTGSEVKSTGINARSVYALSHYNNIIAYTTENTSVALDPNTFTDYRKNLFLLNTQTHAKQQIAESLNSYDRLIFSIVSWSPNDKNLVYVISPFLYNGYSYGITPQELDKIGIYVYDTTTGTTSKLYTQGVLDDIVLYGEPDTDANVFYWADDSNLFATVTQADNIRIARYKLGQDNITTNTITHLPNYSNENNPLKFDLSTDIEMFALTYVGKNENYIANGKFDPITLRADFTTLSKVAPTTNYEIYRFDNFIPESHNFLYEDNVTNLNTKEHYSYFQLYSYNTENNEKKFIYTMDTNHPNVAVRYDSSNYYIIKTLSDFTHPQIITLP